MPKTTDSFDPGSYAPVADRIRLFYETYPRGRILTRLVSRTGREVVFRATVYRDAADAGPAATGWASEREDDGDVNAVACLENTETSAIGRALANLGFTASRQRASAEELMKASRVRARLVRESASLPVTPLPVRGAVDRAAIDDLLRLVAQAEAVGLRAARAERWRRALARADASPELLGRCEQRLRAWIAVSGREGPGPAPRRVRARR